MSRTITDGAVVEMHFKLHVDGQQVDSSDHDPIAYLHGAGNVVPGLERALTGKAVGDRVQVAVAPEEAYGPRRDLDTFRIPRSDLPPGVDLAPGMSLGGEDDQGNVIPFWIVDVDAEGIVVDGNHPLAGKTLNFDVTIVSVRAASQDELEHGHPHGPHGAH
jgi:FKBP-type peptidyl-prolyl cis-trans isomerase SlyD